MTRVNAKYRRLPGMFLEDEELSEEARRQVAERQAFLAERKRRIDAEIADDARLSRERKERERREWHRAKEAERRAKKKAERLKRDAAAACNFDFSYEAFDGWSSTAPWDPGDNLATTETFVKRWLRDVGVDISD